MSPVIAFRHSAPRRAAWLGMSNFLFELYRPSSRVESTDPAAILESDLELLGDLVGSCFGAPFQWACSPRAQQI